MRNPLLRGREAASKGRAGPFAPVALLALFVVLALAVGCGQPPRPATPLTVSASGEHVSLAGSLAAGFNASQRAITATVVTVRERQLAGSVVSNTQAVALGYPLSPAGAFSQTVFALDPLAVTVAFTNPVGALTQAQVREIYAGRVENWAELGGRDGAVMPFSREVGAESRMAFERWALGDGTRLTRNALIVSTDRGMVESLESTPGGIGYALLRALSPNVRPLRLDGEPPSAAAVQQGRYPLVLPVAAITAGPPSDGAAAFVAYLRGRQGQTIIQSAGLVAAR